MVAMAFTYKLCECLHTTDLLTASVLCKVDQYCLPCSIMYRQRPDLCVERTILTAEQRITLEQEVHLSFQGKHALAEVDMVSNRTSRPTFCLIPPNCALSESWYCLVTPWQFLGKLQVCPQASSSHNGQILTGHRCLCCRLL